MLKTQRSLTKRRDALGPPKYLYLIHLSIKTFFLQIMYILYKIQIFIQKKKIFFKLMNNRNRTYSAKKVLESLRRRSILQFFQKETPTLEIFCEYCEIFKNIYFEDYLRTTASYFMKKDRYSWRLSSSSKKSEISWNIWILSFAKKKIIKIKIKIKMHANLIKYHLENCPA